MAINQFVAPKSPIDAIAKALEVAHTVYGIKQAASANEALQQRTEQEATTFGQKQNQYEQETSPDSSVSKLARQGFSTSIQSAINKNYLDRDSGSALLKMVNGDPNDPNSKPMSAKEIESQAETNPLFKFISGAQTAEASKEKLAGLVDVRKQGLVNQSNAAYDKTIGKPYEDRLDAANRVRDLIQKSMNGTLIPTENLGQQFANDITLLQSGKTTVSGTEHARPNTLFGKGGQFAHFLSGDPKAAITQTDLQQMLTETNSLYEDIGKQHNAKFQSWIKGQSPATRDTLNERFGEAREQYFGKSSPFQSGQQQASPQTQQNNDLISAAQAELQRRTASKQTQ